MRTERPATPAFCEAMKLLGAAVQMRREAGPDAGRFCSVTRAADRYSRRVVVLALRD